MKKLIWSYGGGWQSIAIAILIDKKKLRKPDHTIFADTGREKSTTMDYFNENIKNIFDRNGMLLEIADHSLATVDLYSGNGDYLVPAYTKTGALGKFCSKEWKTRVINRYLRSIGYGPDNPVINWIGFSNDEFDRMKDNEASWVENNFPLIYEIPMTKYECIKLIIKSNLPKPSRSSCRMCPYQSDEEWAEQTPEDFQRAILEEKEAREVDKFNDIYFHPDRIPLDEVDFNKKRNQTELFTCQHGSCFT